MGCEIRWQLVRLISDADPGAGKKMKNPSPWGSNRRADPISAIACLNTYYMPKIPLGREGRNHVQGIDAE